MARLRLIATGGTIASRRTPGGLLADVGGSTLLEAAGLSGADDDPRARVLDGWQVEVEDVSRTGGYAMHPEDMLRLAARTRGAFDEGVDAVVVTHGTDTIEESAFLLELLHDRQHPVVVTGAQRAFDSPAPDGPENLLAAVRVATSEHSRGLGVLVVFDGFAWPARGVRKTETLASAAFSAPGRGPCLRLSPDRVLPLSTPWRPHAFPWEPLAPGASGPRLPRVDVVAAYAGSDAALLDAAVAAGARGIVVQALGAGNLPPAMTERVRDLVREGIPVLVSSRVPSGPVSPLYTGGGGADLLRDGAVFAADLSPWQARLLLCVALASRPDEPTRAVRDWLG